MTARSFPRRRGAATRLFILPLLLQLQLHGTARAQKASKSVEQFIGALENAIPRVLADFTVPGAAVALIEDGEVVFQRGFGHADLEKGLEVGATTGFNIGSISKTVAAWGVMKLVHEGTLDLDAPAHRYLSRWRLPASEHDPDGVTIRRMLSHTAGLSLHGYPGWSPRDTLPSIEESLNGRNNGPGRVEIVLAPGTEWRYSGGGYTVLQLIIEEVTGRTFEEYMQSEILDPLGMHNSSYTIDDTILAASAREYDAYGEPIDFELFTAKAAAGLHTTIEDFTRFALASLPALGERAASNPVLPPALVRQMMEPAPASNGGYGLGYLIRSDSTLKGLSGHGGANAGWHAIFRVDPASNDGFIVLTNGGAGFNLCNLVFCEWITWKTGQSPWDGCHLRRSVAGRVKQIVDTEGIGNIGAAYAAVKKAQPEDYDYSESQLNDLGYYYLGRGETGKALAIFKVNVDAFPYAFNVYDSYGEALLKEGERDSAIEYYRRSVRLNPANDNGIRVLRELGVPTDDIAYRMPAERLKLLEGDYEATGDREWKITVRMNDGALSCDDRKHDYRFTLVPIGDDRFVNPDLGGLWRFDFGDRDAEPKMFFGKNVFRKLR